MSKKIFKETSHQIINRVIMKIENYKNQNEIPLYQLLYSKDNQRIIDDTDDIGEPYYS